MKFRILGRSSTLTGGTCSGLASLVRSPDYKGLALWSVAVVGFVAVVERVLHAALLHKIYLNRIVMMYITYICIVHLIQRCSEMELFNSSQEEKMDKNPLFRHL